MSHRRKYPSVTHLIVSPPVLPAVHIPTLLIPTADCSQSTNGLLPNAPP